MIKNKTMQTDEIELIKNLRIKIQHAVPVKENVETWRVIIAFISDFPEKDKLVKEYFIWVTSEYLEDKAQLSADIESAQKFGLTFTKKRFEESGNQIPVENGVSCSNEEGVVIVDPKFFIHPKEKP